MNQKKELERILKGIQEEINSLEKNKGTIEDYDNRVKELKEEEVSIKKDLKKSK